MTYNNSCFFQGLIFSEKSGYQDEHIPEFDLGYWFLFQAKYEEKFYILSLMKDENWKNKL